MNRRATLPQPCSECRPYDGAWRMAENGGMKRCACDRGRALARADRRQYALRILFEHTPPAGSRPHA